MLWAEIPQHSTATLMAWVTGVSTLVSLITAAVIKLVPVLTKARRDRIDAKIAQEKETDLVRRSAYDHVAAEFRDLLARNREEYDRKARENDETIREQNHKIAELGQQLLNLNHVHADCRVKNERLLSRVVILEARLETLRVTEDVAGLATRAEAVIIVDQSGTIREWPPAAAAIFHFRREDAVGKPVTILIPDEFVAEHAAKWEEVASGSRPVRRGPFRFKANTREGGRVEIDALLSQWDDGGNKFFAASVRLALNHLDRATLTGEYSSSREAAIKVARELTTAAGVEQVTAVPTPGGGTDVHLPAGATASIKADGMSVDVKPNGDGLHSTEPPKPLGEKDDGNAEQPYCCP